MSWTAPTIRATGDVITAAIYNTDLVNNIQYLHDRNGTTQHGSFSGSGVTTGTVSFPSAFTGTPGVAVSFSANSGVIAISGISSSGFNWSTATTSSLGSWSCSWIAEGPG